MLIFIIYTCIQKSFFKASLKREKQKYSTQIKTISIRSHYEENLMCFKISCKKFTGNLFP